MLIRRHVSSTPANTDIASRKDNSNVADRLPVYVVRHESILRATLDAQARAVQSNNQVKLDNFKEVIALLARSGAVEYPTSLQERGMQSVVDQMANLSMN